jgi:hypothetical protein
MGRLHSMYNTMSCTHWCLLSFCTARLGLITEEESAKSSVSVDEAMKFMEYEEPNEEEATPMDIDIDADALVWNISLYIVYPNTMHTILLKCLHQ